MPDPAALENARADARSLRDTLITLAADLHAWKTLAPSLESVQSVDTPSPPG